MKDVDLCAILPHPQSQVAKILSQINRSQVMQDETVVNVNNSVAPITVKQKLILQRSTLEAELEKVNTALAQIDANPEAAELFESLNKVGHIVGQRY